MRQATNVTNIRESKAISGANVQGASTMPGALSEGSRPGENNALHIAIAVGALGVLAAAAGYLNVKISGSAGRG